MTDKISNWVTIASVIFAISTIFACGGFANKIYRNIKDISQNVSKIQTIENRITELGLKIESSAATQQAMAKDISHMRLDTSEIRQLIFDTLQNLQKKDGVTHAQ